MIAFAFALPMFLSLFIGGLALLKGISTKRERQEMKRHLRQVGLVD